MKKLSILLLVGSALLYSCSKPDTTPDPTIPIVPIDSTKPNTPSVPLTEQQIIQKASAKFPGSYVMQAQYRVISDIIIFKRGTNQNTIDPDTVGEHDEYRSNVNREMNFPNDESEYLGSFKMLRSPSAFYNKIFVDEVGDSFLGAMCATPETTNCFNYINAQNNDRHDIQRHLHDLDTVSSKSFSYFEDCFNLKAEAVRVNQRKDNWTLFPVHAAKYYYNKDSLVIFELRYQAGERGGNIGSDRFWNEDLRKIRYIYGKKKS